MEQRGHPYRATAGGVRHRADLPSRQFLELGTPRPGGGFELTWTWDVTPLLPGEQTVVLGIIPTVEVKGKHYEGTDVNQPIEVTVDVNPGPARL